MLRIWTHTSIAKWPHLAFERSANVWWNTLQIFAKSPRWWKIPEVLEEQMVAWEQLRKEHGQIGWIVHSNYLANLSKAEDELWVEIESILHDFTLADSLWFEAVNVHIGKEKWRTSKQEAMKHMARNVEKILVEVEKKWIKNVQFLFENTAGQGSEIGSNLEELAELYNNYLIDMPVKYCIDTAHCQWWWIDVAQRDEFVEEFGTKIWIEQLHSIHLNDSKAILWSHLDRHASLWYWFIWFPALSKVIKWANAHDRALYIETPEPDRRPSEIDMVRKIADGDESWIEAFHKEHWKTMVLKKFEGM